jgi:hypothetical protein
VESAAAPSAEVWQVEKASDFEIYSNGLRIENQYAVSHRPRAYRAFSRDYPDGSSAEKRIEPVGIVYHTTESLQAPFEPGQNNVLKRVGESLLEYVRRRRCYNFLIDRFGRVFRIVNEGDAADHAGHSVWADDRYFYVNLNDSFIGISFEAQTVAGETTTSAGSAQVRAGAMLTEMLRSRYKIPGRNCVTHAQVSVNPSNMQIGYHVDWASSFPFEGLDCPTITRRLRPPFRCSASPSMRASSNGPVYDWRLGRLKPITDCLKGPSGAPESCRLPESLTQAVFADNGAPQWVKRAGTRLVQSGLSLCNECKAAQRRAQ